VQTALNRKVCDQGGARRAEANCTTAPARADAPGQSAATGNQDVDAAFDLSKEVSDFYQQIGGFDLTDMIGFGSGAKTLGSTVNFCEPKTNGTECPYQNAFWNGSQMFYGKGFAGADDVVGHEMTHGVISHKSDLFYFFQSGAINESLADTMGEIIDHRNNLNGRDTADSWTIGEDLPGGAIRSMSSPGRFGQPDSMTSSRYDADVTLSDNGGVHTNSGVGNKAAFLIMHGGSFNGVNVSGIDAGDPGLTKSGKLYLDVIEKLTSGSDYADLGRQLTQSCSSLLAAGGNGFTSGDCANVALAVKATALARQPTVANASTPADAPVGCPSGQSSRVLFDDETAPDPATEFAGGSLWTRAPGIVNDFPAASNQTSDKGSWFGLDPDPSLGDKASSALTLAHAVTVPPGGRTYMRFNHWYAFDYSPGAHPVYFDGGLVKVDNTADSAGGQQASGLPWVNGPTRGVFGNSSKRQTGFGGLSNGWVSSRVDLTSYAGKTIKPQFLILGDEAYSIEGWYLDDIEIYTCGEELTNKPAHVTASGGLRSATLSWSAPRYQGDGLTGYRVTGPGGVTRDLPATARSTTFTRLTAGKSYTLAVRGLNAEAARGAAATVSLSGTRFTGPTVARTGASRTKVTGRLIRGSHGVRGKVVQIQRKRADGAWVRVARRTTDSTGHLTTKLSGRSKARYRLVFSGAPGLLGSTSGSRRL
jgi:bacillolysin